MMLCWLVTLVSTCVSAGYISLGSCSLVFDSIKLGALLTWCQKSRRNLPKIKMQAGNGAPASAAAADANAMAMPFFGPPKPLEVCGRDMAKRWRIWRQQWESYFLVTGLSSKDKEVQQAVFIMSIGPDALEVMNTASYEKPEDKKDVKKILDIMEKHYLGEANTIYERYCFNVRNQQDEESFDEYLTELRILSQTCNYGSLEDELTRDRIVCGITSNSVRNCLLEKSDLKLKECIRICRAAEATSARLDRI